MKKKIGGAVLACLIGLGGAGVAIPQAQAGDNFELPDTTAIIDISNAKADFKDAIRNGEFRSALGHLAEYNGATAYKNTKPADDGGNKDGGNDDGTEEVEQPGVDPNED